MLRKTGMVLCCLLWTGGIALGDNQITEWSGAPHESYNVDQGAQAILILAPGTFVRVHPYAVLATGRGGSWPVCR